MSETTLSRRSSLKHEFSLLLDAILKRSKGILLTGHLFTHAFKMIEDYPFLREVNTLVYRGSSYIVYNFFSICALHYQDFPCVAHNFDGMHRPFRPMIDLLLGEDIRRAEMLLMYGFEIVQDCGYCIRDKCDEIFCYGELDLIDVLLEYHKHESIRFIKDVVSEKVLMKRDDMLCKYKYYDVFINNRLSQDTLSSLAFNRGKYFTLPC